MPIILTAFALLLSATFISTAAPTVFLGDSGEIISAAYTLGIGHPPGYPLYMLFSKIFTFIPAGDIAFRANLLSVFFAVLVFFAFYFTASYALKVVFKEEKSTPLNLTALLFSCIYCFSYIFWFQTGNAKGGIYIMAQLFTLLSIMACMKFVFEKKPRYFYMSAYLAGFLPVIHHSASLVTVFVLAALVLNIKNVKPGQAAVGSGFFILSLLTPYLFLFIRAKASPVVHWGGIETFTQVIDHIIRKVYFTLPRGPFTPQVLAFKLKKYLGQFLYCYRPGIIFAFAGLVFLYIRNKKLFFSTASFLILNLSAVVFLTGRSFAPFSVYMNTNFYLINDIAAILTAVAGFYGLLGLVKGKLKKYASFVVAACFIFPVSSYVTNYGVNNQSAKFLAYDNAVNDLKTLKDGDMLFAEEDFQVFNLMYLRYVKHMYPKINIYDRSANFFDTSLFEPFKKAGLDTRLKIKAENREESDFLMMQATLRLERAAEYKAAMDYPGKVYYTTPEEFPHAGIKTVPYGILFKMGPVEKKPADYMGLMQLYSIRDYYNTRVLDLYHRDVAARYFVQMARYEAMKKNMELFKVFRDWSENLAADSGSVMNQLAVIYYYDLDDMPSAISYMEKVMKLNPYDYGALDVLVKFCLMSDRPRAAQWLDYYYTIAPNKKMQNEILVQLEKLRDEK
jgi:tetratricopeptide (TPR) repeat protein